MGKWMVEGSAPIVGETEVHTYGLRFAPVRCIWDYPNLLEGHPDGLGKHLALYSGVCSTGPEVLEGMSVGEVPFILEWPPVGALGEPLRLYGILKGDLTHIEGTVTVDKARAIIARNSYCINEGLRWLRLPSPENIRVIGVLGSHRLEVG